jgi:hypothetical protein
MSKIENNPAEIRHSGDIVILGGQPNIINRPVNCTFTFNATATEEAQRKDLLKDLKPSQQEAVRKLEEQIGNAEVSLRFLRELMVCSTLRQLEEFTMRLFYPPYQFEEKTVRSKTFIQLLSDALGIDSIQPNTVQHYISNHKAQYDREMKKKSTM